MSTLTIRTGNANLRDSSATFAPYLAMSDDTNNGKGLSLREAIVSTDQVSRAGAVTYAPSNPMKPKHVCGTLCTQVIALTEGTVLRFLTMLSPPWGNTKVTTNLFVQARAEASLKRLRVLISDDESLVHNHFEIVGRFELLSGERARDEGCYIDDKFMFLSTRAKQDLAIFDIVEIEPEIRRSRRIRKRRVRSDNGKKTIIRTRARRRGLNL